MSFNPYQFLKDYNISYKTEGANTQVGWININCPMCLDGDSGFHGGFNLRGGYYHCWKCGASQPIKIIQKLLLVDYSQARKVESEYSTDNMINIKLNKKKKATAKKVIPPGTALKPPHRKYLKSRGFDTDYLIEKYKILGTRPGETFLKKSYELRIIIPIINREGTVISFQGRDITGKATLRYKACPVKDSVQDMKQTLYNLNNCTPPLICLTEGVFDVWRMGDGFAATFGTALTEGQLKEIVKYGFTEIFWLFDPGTEAQKKAEAGAYKLASLGLNVELVELTGDKDPGELTPEEANGIRKELGFEEN